MTISGTGFTGVTAVNFGSVTATSFTVNSAIQITATSPTEVAGTVNVTITAAGGVSATSSADSFTYTPLAITSANSTVFMVGATGRFSVKSGLPATFSESGLLPNDVQFTSGTLSGVPATGTAGVYPIVITATGTSGNFPSATQSFTLFVATPAGDVYWLTGAASGNWLVMQNVETNVTQVIDTNVSRFYVDGSGSVVALETEGSLVRFAPNSTARQVMQTGVSNAGVSAIAMDGSGVVFTLMSGGTLVRFAARADSATTIDGDFSSLAAGGAGSIVALDTNNNLWLLPLGSTALPQSPMVTGVQAFVVDGEGSVVAFQPNANKTGGAGPVRAREVGSRNDVDK